MLVLRDIGERGRELEQVLSQYITFVKPAFEEFCLPVGIVFFFFLSILYFCLCSRAFRSRCFFSPFFLQKTKKYADVIIPRGADNLGECLDSFLSECSKKKKMYEPFDSFLQSRST